MRHTSESSGSALQDCDRQTVAAMIRAARAILGWSQNGLARQTGLAQKSIYRIERANTGELRESTAGALMAAFQKTGLRFEVLQGGGFKLIVPQAVLTPRRSPKSPKRLPRRSTA
jgi:transcriptional regulator with XRE-family HTH domain